MSRPRVILADDHILLLEALRTLLEPRCQVVATVSDGRTLVERAVELRPDVVVADIGMPELNGLDAAEALLEEQPGARLIFLTVNEDPDVAADAIRRGALGYLLKKSAATELFKAIQCVLMGQHYITSLITQDPTKVFVARAVQNHRSPGLSHRQKEVLQLLAEGRSMKEAAHILDVTPRTIAFHKYSIMQQQAFKTSAELVRYAVRLGLVSPTGSVDSTC